MKGKLTLRVLASMALATVVTLGLAYLLGNYSLFWIIPLGIVLTVGFVYRLTETARKDYIDKRTRDLTVDSMILAQKRNIANGWKKGTRGAYGDAAKGRIIPSPFASPVQQDTTWFWWQWVLMHDLMEAEQQARQQQAEALRKESGPVHSDHDSKEHLPQHAPSTREDSNRHALPEDDVIVRDSLNFERHFPNHSEIKHETDSTPVHHHRVDSVETHHSHSSEPYNAPETHQHTSSPTPDVDTNSGGIDAPSSYD